MSYAKDGRSAFNQDLAMSTLFTKPAFQETFASERARFKRQL
jgi:hypothetical protein